MGAVRSGNGRSGWWPRSLAAALLLLAAGANGGFAQQYQQLANGTRLRPQRSVLWDPYDSFTDRLQIHFSIGQAF